MRKIKLFAVFAVAVALLAGAWSVGTGGERVAADDGGYVFTFGNSLTRVVTVSDETQIYEKSGRIGYLPAPNDMRYADETAYFIYKVIFPADATDAFIFARVYGANKSVQIKINDGAFHEAAPTYAADAENGVCVWSLADYLDGNELTAEIRFGALNTAQGNGAQLWKMEFICNKDYSPTADPEGAASAVTRIEGEDSLHYRSESTSSTIAYSGTTKYRYFDNDQFGIYEVPLKTKNPVKLELTARLMAGYKVSVSSDMQNWTDVGVPDHRFVWAYDNTANLADYTYDISFLLSDIGDKVYVKFGDVTEYGGWGGGLFYFILREVEADNAPRGEYRPEDLAASMVLSDDGLLAENRGSYRVGPFRAVEGAGNFFTYKVVLEDDTETFSLAIEAEGAVKLEISTDANDFVEMRPSDFVAGSEYVVGAGLSIDLSSRIQSTKTIWLRFSDGNVGNGTPTIFKEIIVAHNRKSIANVNKNIYEVETLEYCVGQDPLDEAEFLYDSVGGMFDWNNKYFDGVGYGIYKFGYEEHAKGLKVIGNVGGSFVLEVSADGTNWSQRMVCDLQNVPGTSNQKKLLFLDVSDLMAGNAERTVYIRLTDIVKSNGWGPNLTGIGLLAYSGDVIGTEGVIVPSDSGTEQDKSGCGSCGSSASASLFMAVAALALASGALKSRR